MATYSYTFNFANLAEEVLDILQKKGDGESLDANDVARLMRAYNVMVTGWKTQGLQLWEEEEGLLFLQKSQAQYNLGETVSTASTFARVINIDNLKQTALSVAASDTDTTITVVSDDAFASGDTISVVMEDGTAHWTTVNGAPAANVITLTDALTDDASLSAVVVGYNLTDDPFLPISRVMDTRRIELHNNNYEITATMVDRETYFQYPDKQSLAAPQQVYYTRKRTGEAQDSRFYVWNTPSSADFGIRFTYEREPRVIQVKEDLLDFPEYWYSALMWNLAKQVKTRFGCSQATAMEIDMQAEMALSSALHYEQPTTDIQVIIDDDAY